MIPHTNCIQHSKPHHR